MKNVLIVASLIGVILGCGATPKARRSESAAQAATVTTGSTSQICDVNGLNCRLVNDTTTVTTGAVVGGVIVGAGAPDSYTFLDTPDANLCVDAFIRQGKTLPIDTVARSLNASSYKSGGIAIMDIETTLVPVLNVIHLDSVYSDVMFQFLNQNGWYCIVSNNAEYSNVTIQRSCQAQMAEIEPISHVAVRSGGAALCGGFFDRLGGVFANRPATRRSIGAIINEVPCIP